MINPVEVIRGDGPVILAQPHCGTFLPAGIRECLNMHGRKLVDTDWHVDRLYDQLLDNVTIVRAAFHRYVIDANRDPSGESLYSNHNTTGLIPDISFDNIPIWTQPINNKDLEARLPYHTAYHKALQNELQRLQGLHPLVVLYDCHSIRSQLPFLFSGRLPDFNIGDNNGQSCASDLVQCLANVCAQTPEYSYVINGRFRGGWTTRYYGRPAEGVHAVQMELAQNTYLTAEEPPFVYSEKKALTLRLILRSILFESERFALERAEKGVIGD